MPKFFFAIITAFFLGLAGVDFHFHHYDYAVVESVVVACMVALLVLDGVV